MGTRITTMRFAAIGVLVLCAIGTSARAATITVTNTNDSGPGSLRQALAIANDDDTIIFAVTGTISLTSGGLLVARNVTISGPGANQLSVDGNQALLVFGIFPDKTAAISGLTVTNGQIGIWNEQGTLSISNCIIIGHSVEGVLNHDGTLAVNNCVVSGNSSSGLVNYAESDGQTCSAASLTITSSTVSNNLGTGIANHFTLLPPPPITFGREATARRSDGFGCGVFLTVTASIVKDNSGPGIVGPGSITILNTTISGNAAGQVAQGGGISAGRFENVAVVTITNSTISGNSAESGGGIYSDYSWLTIVNSTISGNSAGDRGGGILNYSGIVEIANSTISGNSAATGGGIYNLTQFGAGVLRTGNTIFNSGASGENIFNDGGIVTSYGYNISSDDGGGLLNGPGDQINTDPLLGPLQDNGGPTLTHMPLRGSPAIDAGDPNFTPPPFYDQRGQPFVRVFHGRVDIGSVETQPRRSRPTPAPRPTSH